MAGYAHDDAEWAPHQMPIAVVRARTPGDVVEVVRACRARQVAVIPAEPGPVCPVVPTHGPAASSSPVRR